MSLYINDSCIGCTVIFTLNYCNRSFRCLCLRLCLWLLCLWLCLWLLCLWLCIRLCYRLCLWLVCLKKSTIDKVNAAVCCKVLCVDV